MPIPSSPDLLANVLGYAADLNSIPATTPSGSGAFSYQAGFPAITGFPLTAGGVAPSRQDFNGVFNLIGQHLFFLQSGSLYQWNSSLDYLPGAHILGSDGNEYVAQASSGPDVPSVGAKNPISDDGTYWRSVASAEAGNVPIGGVLPFTGTFGGTGNRFPIPLNGSAPLTNWCLCDGTTTNGLPVPDLRGRMILGASSTYAAGSKGGSATHTHSLSGTVGATTLTVNQVAIHAHQLSTDNFFQESSTGAYGVRPPVSGGSFNHPWDDAVSNTGGSKSHTHSLAGSSGSANSLPPYYALALIMRCA